MDHYNAFITDLYGCELSPWLSFEISKKYERRGLVCSCDTALTGIYCELLIECKYSVHIHFCSTRHLAKVEQIVNEKQEKTSQINKYGFIKKNFFINFFFLK